MAVPIRSMRHESWHLGNTKGCAEFVSTISRFFAAIARICKFGTWGARKGLGRLPREARTGSLRQVELRYAVTGALAFGFTLGLVVTYGLAYGRPRAAPSRLSVSKDGSQMPSSSGMRLASLEMPVSVIETDDIDPSALAKPSSTFGDRLLPVERSDSFDQRFKGLAVWADTAPVMVGEREGAGGTARQPTRERATAQSAIGRSPPKPAAASTLVSAEKKRVRTADLSQDSLPSADSHTAVYDIAAHTVYMPNGRRLEAHSGLGNLMDDPSHINAKGRGPTPPNVYDLTLREQLFHGVRALRLNPVDETKMFGRDGILAHTYMLGPNGQSNGCVSFNNYNAFLTAYISGEVTRLVVVDRLANTPGPQPTSQWFADTIKDLLGRS
jgi:Protein of unknown function (DUF2778)